MSLPPGNRCAATEVGFALQSTLEMIDTTPKAQYLHGNILANSCDATRRGRELGLGELNVLAWDIAYGAQLESGHLGRNG